MLMPILKILLKKVKMSTWCILASIILTLLTPLTSKIQNLTFQYIYSGISCGILGIGILLLIIEWVKSKKNALSEDKAVFDESRDALKEGLKMTADYLQGKTSVTNSSETTSDIVQEELSEEMPKQETEEISEDDAIVLENSKTEE